MNVPPPARDRLVQRAPAVFRVAHETVLVRTLDNDSFDLVGAAAAVWLVTDAPGDLAAIALRLAESDILVPDLDDIVELLRGRGLLVETVA
ncbi:MAG: hypothetical protein WCC60_14490 [Ilumatobacteraceae bacterium]